MYANAQHVERGQKTPEDLVNYSKSLHEYTLRLWTESRRKLEQRTAAAQARQQQKGQAQDAADTKPSVEMTREHSK